MVFFFLALSDGLFGYPKSTIYYLHCKDFFLDIAHFFLEAS